MPTYAYACRSCAHRFETVQAFSDASLTECPECGGVLRKEYGSIGVTFNGSGFYRTDSRANASGSKGSSGSGDSGGSGSDSGSGSGSKDSGSKDSSSKDSGSKRSSGSSDSSSSRSSSSGSTGSQSAPAKATTS